MREITIEIKKPEKFVFSALSILSLVIALILYLKLTFSSPIVFGDEGFHSTLAQYIAEKQEYPRWIPFYSSDARKLSFDRPPLYEVLQAGFILLFGSTDIAIKFLVPFIGFLTGISTLYIGGKLFGIKAAFAASIISVTIPSFVTYSVLFYDIMLTAFYLNLCFLLILLSKREEKRIYLLLAGIFAGFAFLSKAVGQVVLFFIPLVLLLELIQSKKLSSIAKYIPLIAVFSLITLPYFLRNFFLYGAFLCNLPLPFGKRSCDIVNFREKYSFSGLPTEPTGTYLNPFQMGITNYLEFAFGPIWFVTLAFLAGLSLLLSRKENIGWWMLLILFSSIFVIYKSIPGRSEDLARYMLPWVPVVSLIAGQWLAEVYEFIKRYQRYLAFIAIVPFVIIPSWLSANGKLEVMKLVKRFSPSFFEACDWVKQNLPKEAVLMSIWSHRAAYNCQRDVRGYIADIAMSYDVNYILSVAKQFGITHIFIQKFSIDLQNRHLSEHYDVAFVNFLEKNPERFEKLYENGPSLQQCIQRGICDGNIIYEIVY